MKRLLPIWLITTIYALHAAGGAGLLLGLVAVQGCGLDKLDKGTWTHTHRIN